MKIHHHILVALMLGTLSFSAIARAEVAPVYDADTMADDDEEAVQDLPPPPPPANGSGGYIAERPTQPLTFEQRLRRAEQQIANMQSNDSVQKVDSLQNQLQSLRNQVEELSHQLQQAEVQQKSMYADLDKRIANATAAKSATPAAPAKVVPAAPAKPTTATTTPTAAAPAPATASKQPEIAEEQKLYQTAYNLIKSKKYTEAVNALQSMLNKYPSGQFAANAHYWLGELYGLLGDTDKAFNAFNAVIKNYPNSPRVADAQLKVGIIYAAQNKLADAKGAFKKVISRYPGTATARLASEQLKQLK